MSDSEPAVTILRGSGGAPQYAVLDWQGYQDLLRAARPVAAPPRDPALVSRAARRLGADIASEVPMAVVERERAGTHPVRAWRECRGHNQAQLAAMAGISRAYLAQIETGERTGTLEVTARLARSLGCLIEDLLDEEGAGAFDRSIATLAGMAERAGSLIAEIPRESRHCRPAAGGFSLVEHICHLRDIDAEGYLLRLERMLAEPDAQLHDIDGDKLARERDYQGQDLEAAFAAFGRVRGEIVARLAGLSSADRQRAGTMDGVRRITIAELVEAMLEHDSAHLQELAALCDELRGAVREDGA